MSGETGSNNDEFAELAHLTSDQIYVRGRMLEHEIRVLVSEIGKINYEYNQLLDRVKEYNDRISINKSLPYLVSNISEKLDIELEEDEYDDAELVAAGKRPAVIIKTSTRQTYFVPRVGLVDPETLSPGVLVGVNKDTSIVMEVLPEEFDPRVKVMEIVDKPTDDYTHIGGLDKQISELLEAVVLPISHREKFLKLGIKPPKGVLLYGPPGTGKTLLARACAAQTNATFMKLAAPQLVQMFIGDGAKMVRDAFALAKQKKPTIIFIDELDAIGQKRFNTDKAGDREVQRTMLELLNQLDGFTPIDEIKVIAATNRVDTLDPALLRSGRIDMKIEFPVPNEEARARILQIHSRTMTVAPDISFQELARSTEYFNGAMLRAVCVEAGMTAMKRGADKVDHEDFVDAVAEVQAKKKSNNQNQIFS